MMVLSRRILCVVSPILCSCPTFAAAQLSVVRGGEVRGIVVDSAGSPISGVEVFAAGTAERATSGSDGRFRLRAMPSGTTIITARKPGYSAQEVTLILAERDTANMRITLNPLVPTLGEVTIREEAVASPRFDGFNRRRKQGTGGRFVTQADIERRSPAVTTELLRRVPGVRIADSMGVALAVSTRSDKPRVIGKGGGSVPCVMRVGVDGFLKDPTFAINSILPHEIYGIEVYSGPSSIPGEFGGARADAYCGLIMIWTRAQ